MAIELRCGPAVLNVDSWETVAKASDGITKENFVHHPGQAVAMLDRNCVSEPWRKIFAVCGAEDEVYIFNGETGAAVDEPEAGVPAGITPLKGEEGTFLSDWEFGYYKGAFIPDWQLQEVVAETEPAPEAAQVDQADRVEFVCDERCVQGARIAIAFDNLWEGCIVDEVLHDPPALLLAFDDGDLAVRTGEQIKQDIEHECLKFLSPETNGIVKSTEGVPAAIRAARAVCGRQSLRAVGVLVGASEYCIAGDNIFQSFFVDADAFKDDTGSTRRGGAPSAQDRYGFRSFRRGDVVAYLHVSDGEECKAHVFGVTWPEADAGRKYLLLQEAATSLFFVATFSDWRRVHNIEGAELDNNDTAVSITSAEKQKMVNDWEASDKLAHLDTAKKVANHTRNWPPHLRAQRAEAARLTKEAGMEEAKEKRRKLRVEQSQRRKDLQNEQRLAAAKAAAKGKGKGKGGRNGRGGRGNIKSDTAAAADDDDDDDGESLAARLRGRQMGAPAAAAAAAETKRLRDETKTLRATHTAEMQELQRQLAVAQAGRLQLPPTDMPPQPQPTATLLPKGEPPVAQPVLPPGWRVAKDGAGRSYFYNKSEGISTYDRPGADSPPLPPPPPSSKPSPPCVPRSSDHGAHDSFEVEQRRYRIAHIKGYLPHCVDRSEVAALNGELAVLQREEHFYREQRRLF